MDYSHAGADGSMIELARARQRLMQAAADIGAAMRDVDSYETDAARAATIAALCAATLMVTDIIRISMSAMDRRARFLFGRWDEAENCVYRAVGVMGGPKKVSRDDLLKGLDQNLRPAGDLIQAVRTAQGGLRTVKLNPPKGLGLVIDLGLAMSADTLLMVQAGQTEQAAHSSAHAARQGMRRTLTRLQARIFQIDREFTSAFDRAGRFGVVA